MQTTIPENQKICLMPMNDITSTIFYDDRIAISQPIKTPITWKVTKVDNTNPNGITAYTFSQDRWNEHTDVFEYRNEKGEKEYSHIFDNTRKIYGIYADYGTSSILPVEQEDIVTSKVHGEFSWSAKLQVKVGGSYKKLSISFYNEENEKVEKEISTWRFNIGEEDASNLVDVIQDENMIKMKFLGDDSYIGSVLTVTCVTSDGIITSADVEILGL